MVPSSTVEARRGMDMSGGRIAAVLLPLALAACVRPPIDEDCPALAEGDLVISEIRAQQSGSYPQWVELYNASDAPISPRGVRLEFSTSDGKSFFAFFVRDEALTIEPGDYFVVGGGSTELFAYLDYDFTPDHHSADNPELASSLYPAGILELSVCGDPLDRVIYTGPKTGTLALDGSQPPDAASNDHSDEGWCFDGSETNGILNGTPGEANPPCP